MSEIEKQQLQKVNEIKELDGVLELLALEYVKNGVTYKQACESLKKAMIIASKKLGNKKKVAIALSTGIDRREINTEYKPYQYQNKIIPVISEIRNYKIISKNKTIAIKGPKPSIQFFSSLMSGRITVPAIVDELCRKKIIKVIGHNKAQILKTRISSVETDFERYRLINKQARRQITTINHNYQSTDDKWLDYSFSSTKINKSNQHKLNQLFRDFFDLYRPKGVSLLEEYESDVPNGTYGEYSFNLFINISEE
jgi:hypothetical protein